MHQTVRKNLLKKIMIYICAVVLFIYCVGPLFLTLLGGVIPDKALLSVPPRWFSISPTLDFYKYIFLGKIPESYEVRGALRGMISAEARQIPIAMKNSIIIGLFVMGINILFGSMAAYAFSRIRFKGKKLTFLFIIMCRLLPAATLVVPFYLIIQSFGLLNTILSVVMVHSIFTLPFTVLILTIFFRKIPVSIEESAIIDGAGPLKILTKIYLPLSAGPVMATGLFSFMLSYSEYMYSLILTGTEATRTVPVVMAALSTNPDVAWGMLMACVFITLVPTLVLVIFIWRFVVEGILFGGGTY